MATDKKEKSANYYEEIIRNIEKLMEEEKHDEALDILVEELGMPYIPAKYEDEFSKLFQSVTIAIEDKELHTKFRTVLTEEEILDALNNEDAEPIHLELAINSLKKINVRTVLDQLKEFLANDKKDDFVKTLILIELISQEVDEDIVMFKEGNKITLNPKDITPIEETRSLAYVSRALEEKLFQDQTQQIIALGLMQTYMIFLYPTEILPQEYDLLAAACHYMSSIYLRKQVKIPQMAELYGIKDQMSLTTMVEKVQKQLEKRQTAFQ